NALSSSRMPHGAHILEVDGADELHVERRSAGRAEGVPEIQVMLNELGPGARTEIEDRIISCVDAVCTNRDDDVAIAGKNRVDVGRALKAENRAVAGCAGPFEKRGRPLKTGHMTAMEEDDQRKRTGGESRGIVDRRSYFNRRRETSRLERRVAEIV